MKTKEFFFDLPPRLIAQFPSEKRGDSRLLVLHRASGTIEHKTIGDFVNYVDDDTVIVVNNSKVRKARLYGISTTGGKVEFLLVRKVNDKVWLVIAKKRKKQRIGKKYTFPGEISGILTGEYGDFLELTFSDTVNDSYLDIHGHIPLPPYIKRDDNKEDFTRYQTVYAKKAGSTAAPTAGLHFTKEMIQKLKAKNISLVPVTLHVGMGTFIPVRSEEIENHSMHEEEYEISSKSAEIINKALSSGKKILAVGTTSVRTMESAWKDGQVLEGKGKTSLYIYPGYKFKVVDKLLTNFHTPDSSLIILVSAFAGTDTIKNAYKRAIEEEYRFFSYGDAMLII